MTENINMIVLKNDILNLANELLAETVRNIDMNNKQEDQDRKRKRIRTLRNALTEKLKTYEVICKAREINEDDKPAKRRRT